VKPSVGIVPGSCWTRSTSPGRARATTTSQISTAPSFRSYKFTDGSAAPQPDVVTNSRHFRLLPGDGELALDRFVAAVRSTGFDGIVAAEVLSQVLRHDDPTNVATRIHDALRRYWTAEPALGVTP